MQFGSKEHTILAYKVLRYDMEVCTKQMLQFFEWLHKENKLHHLKDYDKLTLLEQAYIKDLLNEDKNEDQKENR